MTKDPDVARLKAKAKIEAKEAEQISMMQAMERRRFCRSIRARRSSIVIGSSWAGHGDCSPRGEGQREVDAGIVTLRGRELATVSRGKV